MVNEKMNLIKHMALLRNIANDVTEIMSSTAAADFINAAIEIINNYPNDGKLVDTGTSSLHLQNIIKSLPPKNTDSDDDNYDVDQAFAFMNE